MFDSGALVSTSGTGTSFSRHFVDITSTADKTPEPKRALGLDEQEAANTATVSQSK